MKSDSSFGILFYVKTVILHCFSLFVSFIFRAKIWFFILVLNSYSFAPRDQLYLYYF